MCTVREYNARGAILVSNARESPSAVGLSTGALYPVVNFNSDVFGHSPSPAFGGIEGQDANPVVAFGHPSGCG
jgi:hypothetical protein